VKILSSTTCVCLTNKFSIVFVAIPTLLIVNSPESPKNSGESDKHTEGSVENHVCFPLVTHVTSCCNLNKNKYVPAEEVDVTMSKEHSKCGFNICFSKIELLSEHLNLSICEL